MVQASYNPFSNKENERTEHGLINYRHDMGTVYVTHRKPEHFFKKFQGFGISKTELEIAFNKKVFWVLIIYHSEKGNIVYRYKLEDVQYLNDYNNNGDLQLIFPIKLMNKKTIGNWE